MRIGKQWMVLVLLAVLLTGCAFSNVGETDSGAPAGETDGANVTEESGETNTDLAVLDEIDVTLYLPNGDATGFDTVEETVEASPQGIVDALIAHGTLPEGVTVDAFLLTGDGAETQEGDIVSYEPGELSIDLDLSEEFLPAVAETGTAGESMVLGSLVNTMLTAYNAQTLTLTCGGEVVETGHAVYDEPLTFFEFSWQKNVQKSRPLGAGTSGLGEIWSRCLQETGASCQIRRFRLG